MYINYIVCSNCDYESEMGDFVEYRYKNVAKSIYPIIKYGWCNDCKRFVNIQMGISVNTIDTEMRDLQNCLNKYKHKLFKTNSVKSNIKNIEEKINELSILKSLIKGSHTVSSCTRCNGINIVFKDVEKQLWCCPKCHIGQLGIKKSDISLFIKPKTEYIIPNQKERTISYFTDKSMMCSLDLINNTGIYYAHLQSQELIEVLSRKASLINRFSLIYAFLKCIYKVKINQTNYWKTIEDNLLGAGIISSKESENLLSIFNKMVDFYVDEIEVEMNCSVFMPTFIISALRNPEEEIEEIRKQEEKINPVDAITEWKIISDTINAYFKYK